VVISRGIFLAILAALVAERIFELWLSNRNARLAFARGGIELGRGQYRVIVAFHMLFIAACAAGAMRYAPAFPRALTIVGLAGEAVAQALRYWSVATLGQSWNTRVIVIPDIAPVTSGPYRYIRHPNYVAVALEIACVPLIRGLVTIAIVFSAGNAILLGLRIPLEERALGEPYHRGSLPAAASFRDSLHNALCVKIY
jgi:methyltransferase